MRFIDYLVDKIFSIVTYIIVLALVISFLEIFKVNTFLIVYIPLFITIGYLTIFLYDFFRKRDYYNKLFESLNELDKKYLIQEIISKPNFLEGKLLYETMQEVNRAMVENVNSYLNNEREFKEYIEMWVHEIKTPISSTKLIIENNSNEVTKNIDEEIDKIDKYIEQVLYYARSDNVHKDYIIKEITLEDVVNKAIYTNKKELILRKIKLNLYNLEVKVNSDIKWLEYILKQIIENSIKYSKTNSPEISIYCEKYDERVELFIKDNGIGIDKKDIQKIFDKGFTGENGRKIYKSTGIGMYLCKKLCKKLGHDIEIYSSLGEGTTIKIIFPTGSFSKM